VLFFYDEALKCFDRALEIDPQSLEAVQFKKQIAQSGQALNKKAE